MVPGGQIVSARELKLARSEVFILKKFSKRDRDALYAFRVRTYSNLDQLWSDNLHSFLRLSAHAKDSVSGLPKVYETEFHDKASDVVDGEFEVGLRLTTHQSETVLQITIRFRGEAFQPVELENPSFCRLAENACASRNLANQCRDLVGRDLIQTSRPTLPHSYGGGPGEPEDRVDLPGMPEWIRLLDAAASDRTRSRSIQCAARGFRKPLPAGSPV